MILDQLRSWQGAVEINGTHYSSISEAEAVDLRTVSIVNIKLLSKRETRLESGGEAQTSVQSVHSAQYKITVKQYMTKQATPSFDFMKKWNNNQQMPLCTMIGTIEKETKGMVYMKLHGDITTKKTAICMRCGRPLTNPVSQFFGLGPECGGHNYVSPFANEDDLLQAVERYRKEYLQKITWEGWVIKSAIIEQEEI